MSVFDPLRTLHGRAISRLMYRKDADRRIVRDVRIRLRELRKSYPWADWGLAATASWAAHPEWYAHHQSSAMASVEALLRKAGIDMSEPEKPFRFVGNIAADE